ETSLVAIPANPNALAVAKSLRISPATISLVFAEPGRENTRTRRRGVTGESALASRNRRGATMSLSQRIKDSQERKKALMEQLEAHLKNVDDSNVSDPQLEITHELNEKIAREEKGLAALLEAESHLAASSDADASGGGDGGSRAITVAGTRQTRNIGGGRTPFNLPKTKEERLDVLVRAGVTQMLAHTFKISIEQAAQKAAAAGYVRYIDETTKVLADYCARAASAPAMTTVTGWAAELVQQ